MFDDVIVVNGRSDIEKITERVNDIIDSYSYEPLDQITMRDIYENVRRYLENLRVKGGDINDYEILIDHPNFELKVKIIKEYDEHNITWNLKKEDI